MKTIWQISPDAVLFKAVVNTTACYFLWCLFWLQGLEGEDEGAISMLSDNTAKLTSAVR